MSSSGLIYAVIVGAWAAYLVPMWLRRQDELNEARPTERFSTAIRLLSGRAAMERKISRQLEETQPLAVPTPHPHSPHGPGAAAGSDGQKGPAEAQELGEPAAVPSAPAPSPASSPAGHQVGPSPAVASRRRAALLARRRRMVVILFAAFTAGMVVAAVGGVALLWIPALPAVLFSIYIAQMRRQEHRRYEVKLDRRRAAEAAQRVRQQAVARREAATAAAAQESGREWAEAVPSRVADEPGQVGPTTSGTGALGANHAESWADDDRPEHAGGAAPSADRGDQGWDPVPVPLPTYVTAPVAPRATLGLDLTAPDTYSSARARPTPPSQQERKAPAPAPRRPAPKPATPLFDQYAEGTPRAANE
ncbi:divisome protein SepX/GlpR [Streptacidiphilus melanogenes]|uniref:divisome protein SepX/GlpR n=1 Tax=Streptacidiphilus melanogenes TaxID=411235 RepID=UPI0005AA84D1|nr:gephyrin-like molybdotransferase receptor GlpR [Streptacidiphilus melanogenes]